MFVTKSIGLLRKYYFFKQDISGILDNNGKQISVSDFEAFKNYMKQQYDDLDFSRKKVERIKEINNYTSILLDRAHHNAKYGYYYGVNMNLPFNDYEYRKHSLLKPYFTILANKERMLADTVQRKLRELEFNNKLKIGSDIVTSDAPEAVIDRIPSKPIFRRKKKGEVYPVQIGLKHKFTRGILRHWKDTRSGYDKEYYPNH